MAASSTKNKKKKTSSAAPPRNVRSSAKTGKAGSTRSTGGKAAAKKKSSSSPGRDVLLLCCIALSLLLFLSLFGLVGKIGAVLSRVQFGLFGSLAYLFPFLLLIGLCFLMINLRRYPSNSILRFLAGCVTFTFLCGLAELAGSKGALLTSLKAYYEAGKGTRFGGGLFGGFWCRLLVSTTGRVGCLVILFLLFLIGLVLTLGKALLTALGIKSRQVRTALKDERQRYRNEQEERQKLAQLRMEERMLQRAQAREEEEKRLEEERKKNREKFLREQEAREERRRKELEETDLKLTEVRRKRSELEKQQARRKAQREADEEEIARSQASAQPEEEGILPENTPLGQLFREMEETKAEAGRDVRTLDELKKLETPRQPRRIGTPADLFTEDLLMTNGIATGDPSVRPVNRYAEAARAKRPSAMRIPEQKKQKDDTREAELNAAFEEYEASRREAENAPKEPVRIRYAAPPESEKPEPQQSKAEEKPEIVEKIPEEPEESLEDPRETLKKIQDDSIFRKESDKDTSGSAGKTFSSPSAARPRAPKADSGNVPGQESLALTPNELPKKEYKLPPISLLKRGSSGARVRERELKATALKLEETLRNFGVEATVTDISCGPSVTRFELRPEQGVKVSRISGLADDIKLALAATEIRIEAPIPGKSAVGIEVPNPEKQAVSLRSIVESEELAQMKSRLAFAVGQDIAGQVVVADLAKMPHLLIAGATGSGKSVCLNSLIISILYRAKPDEVQFIMIDPKVVELRDYNGVPHLRIPVVTDPKLASEALNGAVKEMTGRYKKFADLNVRDIRSYNAKIRENPEEYADREILPQIVVIVDEFADLMMVAASDVEQSVCRLAQLARAAGIHLVLATQRPSVNVITGLIKANIQSRIALTVSSGVDSRTIIDMNGAEKLLGKGDMLFYPTGYPKPVRVQGCWVSDEEIEAVTDFWKKQTDLTEEDMAKQNSSWMHDPVEREHPVEDERDELFVKAAEYIIENEKASIGNLQRIFRIGFNRAARLMDQLADAGIVGRDEGTKARQILLNKSQFEDWKRENGYQ
ncbi:MAG: DNA translocase FtsK 4TM domain-containing protein [Lachnospiraceae bacterium]|nr:DNA translocase FtsK 4TM domain-containing protein [Lachnospiraceae bacterium]